MQLVHLFSHLGGLTVRITKLSVIIWTENTIIKHHLGNLNA